MSSDKVAVLGLVSNHGEVESAEYVRRRLDEASRFLPLEQLGLCPRCGLSSSDSDERQWSKLRLIQSVADEVWG
jgi:5-methyltetrahydropteroyltriglutamate--homocysteine methyltransferase